MNKKLLIDQIINFLQKELSALQTAANNAHLAAIDDQSVAETQYDTLAIEAGYLAEGQSRRVLELKLALQPFNDLAIQLDSLTFDEDREISIGALIQLEQGKALNQWFFLAPAAAGFKTTLTANDIIQHITVITAKSPLGEALLGQYQDDDVTLIKANNTVNNLIYRVL